MSDNSETLRAEKEHAVYCTLNMIRRMTGEQMLPLEKANAIKALAEAYRRLMESD